MTEEKKARGQLIPERPRQRNLRTLLLRHYEANAQFMAALRLVMARHRRFLSAEERFSFEAEVNEHHYWQCQQIFEQAKASGNRWMAEQAIHWAEAIWRRQASLRQPYRRHQARGGPYGKQLEELAKTWGFTLRLDRSPSP